MQEPAEIPNPFEAPFELITCQGKEIVILPSYIHPNHLLKAIEVMERHDRIFHAGSKPCPKQLNEIKTPTK